MDSCADNAMNEHKRRKKSGGFFRLPDTWNISKHKVKKHVSKKHPK